MTIGLKDLLDKADKKLLGVNPLIANKARQIVQTAFKEGINVIITQGLRTIDEQNALYAQGRTKPGKVVTNAKGGYSYHNYGLAVDFALLNADGSVCWDVNAQWKRVAAIGKSLGLEWGGDWTGFKDYPHFQYTFGLSLADLRAGKRPAVSTETVKEEVNTVGEIKYIYTGGYAGPALLTIHDYLFKRGHGFDCKRGKDGSIIFLVGPFDTSQPNWKEAYDSIIQIDPGMRLYNPGQAVDWRK